MSDVSNTDRVRCNTGSGMFSLSQPENIERSQKCPDPPKCPDTQAKTRVVKSASNRRKERLQHISYRPHSFGNAGLVQIFDFYLIPLIWRKVLSSDHVSLAGSRGSASYLIVISVTFMPILCLERFSECATSVLVGPVNATGHLFPGFSVVAVTFLLLVSILLKSEQTHYDVLFVWVAGAAAAPWLRRLIVDSWTATPVSNLHLCCRVAIASYADLARAFAAKPASRKGALKTVGLSDAVVAGRGMTHTGLAFQRHTSLGVPVIVIEPKALNRAGPLPFRQRRIRRSDCLIYRFNFHSVHQHLTDAIVTVPIPTGDRRATRQGKLLQRLCLGELPQQINLHRGEMSLMGPRPHAPHASVDHFRFDELDPDYVVRHRVRPSITGWTQINGARGAVDQIEQANQRLTYVVRYVEKWSLWLHHEIVVLTFGREIIKERAY